MGNFVLQKKVPHVEPIGEVAYFSGGSAERGRTHHNLRSECSHSVLEKGDDKKEITCWLMAENSF